MTCKVHRRYGAKRKPRVPCEACWFMWISKEFVEEPGYVACARLGEIHDATLDPYQYGPPTTALEEDMRCQPDDHQPVYVRVPRS